MSPTPLPTPVRRPDDPDLLPPGPAPAPGGHDLLKHRPIRALVRSRWYPGIFQVPVAAVFGLVAYQLLAGPRTAHDNSGTALMWVLWWPVLPMIFVVAGRFWCAVCPFGLISDVVRRLVGVERPVPRFLKQYGIWIIDAQFLLITWSDHIWGVVESPWGSGVLLLLLTTAVVVSGAFFGRRTFCRYLCFLGGLCGNYARTGALTLRADTDVCATCTARAACYNGTDTVEACPLFTFPRTMDAADACSLCGNCVKSCPNDAISIRVGAPTRDLWTVRKPKIEESFLAMAIMGIVLVQNVTMLSLWGDVTSAVHDVTGITNSAAIFTAAFALAVALPVAALLLASRVAAAGNLESTWGNFARFGYALIPLDVAAHLAHNLFHLLAEGRNVVYSVAGLAGVGPQDGPAALTDGITIRVLQWDLLLLGAVASCYVAWRLASGRYRTSSRRRATVLPMLVLVVAFAGLNAYLVTLPMGMRM